MQIRRPHILAGIGLFAMLAGYWLLRPRPILVETAVAVEETFRVFVEVDGRTRVRDRYTVSAPLSGRVGRSTWDEGDAVRAGQVLMTIAANISPLLDERMREELLERVGAAEAAVAEAVAMVERANVALEQAKTELDRTRLLRQRDVASIAKLERDEFALRVATRERAAAIGRKHVAEHLLKQARAALKRSGENGANHRLDVTSPIDGQILKVVQKSEAAVATGATLLEIGDPHDLEVVADVLTTDAARISAGARVELLNWGGDGKLAGRVRRIEPSGFTKISALGVEEQRVWLIADITSPPGVWRNLGDGYRVDLRILTDEIERAVVIPVGALFRKGEQWQLFTLENGTARLRNIQGIIRSGRQVAIGSGLSPDERVIVYPSGNLSDGSSVRTN